MDKLNFRTLRADEIDVRIGMCKENGLTLLLYKDARCDMNILDDAVGCLNWKREHTRDNANCIVSIWDDKKSQWVSKEDTGSESNTEKEKGLASDSFKRACVNWGIGRELYTTPFIWVNKELCDIKKSNDRGKEVFKCYDKFCVEGIRYDEETRKIVVLAIRNERTQQRVFAYNALPKENVKEKTKNE